MREHVDSLIYGSKLTLLLTVALCISYKPSTLSVMVIHFIWLIYILEAMDQHTIDLIL